jgi:hypothetical protein
MGWSPEGDLNRNDGNLQEPMSSGSSEVYTSYTYSVACDNEHLVPKETCFAVLRFICAIY